MQYAQDIALRRVDMLIEQYVVARGKSYDFVSTELASKAIRSVMHSPVGDVELDLMLARKAVQQGLSVRFDRNGHWSDVSPSAGRGG
ncbi:MAG: hypothetical protein EOS78_04815 [Mesorhizobium sp.]|uniref:hypothetical protein n=1 Tax=unclassified Mesorhizobium TaxID=325217 RepID=UPI000F761854|nr:MULTISPECIES: hypothetical protein [unclassified Mesorhizobium]AZO56392.1 hypothetical protein EJ077_25550 [Mesorhizobium sp. M8A.F.Ca.ET.057.01.1.1]RWE42710.1 MAG: hypothetical protein EOS78_04815 [Mesorhizobium sp.]RWE48730.1 MAG: hypothetical protein EOS80_04260 [Mesorhizobium sp.]